MSRKGTGRARNQKGKTKVTHPKESKTYIKTFKGRDMSFPLSSTPNLKQ